MSPSAGRFSPNKCVISGPKNLVEHFGILGSKVLVSAQMERDCLGGGLGLNLMPARESTWSDFINRGAQPRRELPEILSTGGVVTALNS
jgi:hypothetical protein